jgi:hypothetical protein
MRMKAAFPAAITSGLGRGSGVAVGGAAVGVGVLAAPQATVIAVHKAAAMMARCLVVNREFFVMLSSFGAYCL